VIDELLERETEDTPQHDECCTEALPAYKQHTPGVLQCIWHPHVCDPKRIASLPKAAA
jgi:hypothetical protein